MALVQQFHWALSENVKKEYAFIKENGLILHSDNKACIFGNF